MKTKIHIITALLIALGGSAAIQAQDAATIIAKMDQVLYAPKDMKGTNTLILIDKNGKEEIREADLLQKGTDKRMMRFTSPASQAGISVLALPEDVMYLYLPAFGKERRISASVKNQNFAGTDFSYDDMEPKPYADKYDAKLLKTEASVFILELVPKIRSDYSKLIIQVDKTNYYPVSMEYYDQGGTKVKEAAYHFKKVGKYWSSEEVEMKDLKKNHSTKMRMSGVEYDLGLSDDEFTVRKLKQ